MPDIDLASLSRDALMRLRRDIDAALAAAEQRQRQDALAAAEAAARAHGFALADLAGPKTGRRLPLPPKYRHPDDPDLTWSGRGPQPKWLREAVVAGTPIETFRIAP